MGGMFEKEGLHPVLTKRPGPVKLSAGRFSPWTMVPSLGKLPSPEDFRTVPWCGFSGRAKDK
eukprot:116271-Ditylum_brightwellii.AAC.1